MRRAIISGVAIAISAPPIGVFLTLRRMSLMGEAMSHAILPGVALGYLFAGISVTAMTIGGFLIGFAVAVLASLTAHITPIKEEATFASFHLIAFALGIILLSLQHSPEDLLHILFGSILTLNNMALFILISAAIITICGLLILFRPLVIDSIDTEFLYLVEGRSSHFTYIFFLGLLLINLVSGFHALGTLMTVGIMVLPAVSAQFWKKDLFGMIIFSILIGIISVYSGLILSYHLDLPAGPAITLIAGMICISSILLGKQGGIIWQLMPSSRGGKLSQKDSE